MKCRVFFRQGAIQSAILPIVLGSSRRAVEAMRQMGEAGYFVPAIRFPTVPRDTARLRVTISARHTPEQIKGCCAALRDVLASAEQGSTTGSSGTHATPGD